MSRYVYRNWEMSQRGIKETGIDVWFCEAYRQSISRLSIKNILHYLTVLQVNATIMKKEEPGLGFIIL